MPTGPVAGLHKGKCANQGKCAEENATKAEDEEDAEEEVAEKKSAAISLCGQPPLTFITPTNRQQ